MQQQPIDRAAKAGRLQARPLAPTGTVSYGRQTLGVAAQAALLYVPAGYQPTQPAPLAVILHGAGGKAEQGLALLQGLADELGLLLLAPAACQYTWDIILDDYGPDIAGLDAAVGGNLCPLCGRSGTACDRGFSDGAS